MLACLFATPALAIYTECTVTKDMDLATRPNGPTEVRYRAIVKGDKVAFRGTYRDWWFVMHAKDEGGEHWVDYGWVRQKDLNDCETKEGTP